MAALTISKVHWDLPANRKFGRLDFSGDLVASLATSSVLVR